MKIAYRVLVFGLPSGTTQEEVSALAGPSMAASGAMVESSDGVTPPMGVLSLFDDTSHVRRVVQHIERQRRCGHHLTTWLCVMPWV